MMIHLAPSYRHALIFSLALQVPILLFFSLLLDGGYLQTFALCAAAGYWIGVIMVMVRHHASPKKLDIFYIRWGFLILLTAAIILGKW